MSSLGHVPLSSLCIWRKALLSAFSLLVLVQPEIVNAQWPKEIAAEQGRIIVYQPQTESLHGNVLKGRAAMSLELEGEQEPIFGAFWFSASIDADEDTVVVRNIDVTKVTWPDSKQPGEQKFTEIVEDSVSNAGIEISRERLSASLEAGGRELESLDEIKNDPPNIVFKEKLSILLSFDGDPIFKTIDSSNYERAVNTPLMVVRDQKTGQSFLGSDTLWYQASHPLGPWVPIDQLPKDLQTLLPDVEVTGNVAEKVPEIVVATEATELVVTDGKPQWGITPGGDLLYVENTETPWLRHSGTGEMFVLLSGRWFKSDQLNGPWEFTRADELPQGFRDIPPASDIGGVRVSVAGTDEADAAVEDAWIPQTAAIKRDEAELDVEYDGTPRFEKIPGTNVSYAVNTGAQVLMVGKTYYAVDKGVWFTADKAAGPWVVADDIPEDEIAKIPPSSPVYNTTYVKIYESTPEVVYVGYTPGYLWSFPYYGVPVYGTGWYYPPYRGAVYYPRTPTWGFHVGYNSWSGWNFGVSWSSGFFSFGASFGGGWGGGYRPWGCCGGWYGGGYHRGPTFINTGDINIGNTVNAGNREALATRVDNANINRSAVREHRNLYNQTGSQIRNLDRSTAYRNLEMAKPAVQRANDVYVDDRDNIARRTSDGSWEMRENNRWQAVTSPTDIDTAHARTAVSNAGINQPALPSAMGSMPDRSSLNVQGLNRNYAARQTGARREVRHRAGGMRRRR